MKVFLTASLLFFSTFANAESAFDQLIDDYDQKKEDEELARRLAEEEKKNQTFLKSSLDTLDELHDSFSDNILTSAEGIDNFFINERVTDGHNQTNLRIINTASVVERQGLSNHVDFRFRLRLPKLEKKFQFEIGQQVNDLSNRGAVGNQPINLLRNQDRSARTGISFFHDILSIQTKLTGGVRYQAGVIPWGNYRISRDFVLTKKQKISLIDDLFTDTRDKSGTRFTFYYDYSFKPYMFRFLTETTYLDLNHSLEVVHGLVLFHTLSPTSSLVYQTSVDNYHQSGPHTSYYVNSYTTSMTYRYLAYKNYVFFEFSPAVTFPKQIQLRRQLQFYFRIEVLFGHI